MANDLRLEISDFRAIGHADIILDGITVIAGENGSGKSTISKLLYHTIKVVNEYDIIIDEQLKSRLRRISSNFKDILRDYSYVFEDREKQLKDLTQQFSNVIDNLSIIDDNEGFFIELTHYVFSWIEEIISAFQDTDWQNKMKLRLRFRNMDVEAHIDRINKSLLNSLPQIDKDKVSEPNLADTFNLLIAYIRKLYSENNQSKYYRYIDELFSKLEWQFETNGSNINYNIFDSGVSLIDRDNDKLSNINDIERVVYIDTPMAVGNINGVRNEHWNDLNKLLANDSYLTDNTFSNQIIHGSAKYERSDLFRSKFVFKRDDGKEFNLMEVATGVKSFSILQMLLNNGSLNSGTLLILDEPEAHLHPQWIVEYGRFLVYLNKEVGVKLLVASHSPDMVSALKYITEKEGNPEILNFYLAEQRESEYKYDYRHLGTEIDAIFESYNKSYEKLDNYAD